MSVDQAISHYQQLYALGTLSSAHFGIEIEPFSRSGKVGNSSIPIFEESTKVEWLANNVDISVFDAQTDSTQVGAFQLNFITGNNSGEISATFIETRDARILNSARAIKACTFNKDGTQNPPIDYLLRIKIYAFDRGDRNVLPFSVEHIVFLQTGSIPLDASNKNGVGMVQLNFTKAFPMLLSGT
ncbi:hypothetical protein [Acinetobacter chinensis]|uniref:hypothetical protein n=1 Tax=Acinetobacter chinensis TaxID=2004650 RepID=UPI002934C343|nr:hypothetical protein [Acinetobacter chinensis]WOE40048.1 hypothetical protein QSG87_08990 [Acinetobacter chinensis]